MVFKLSSCFYTKRIVNLICVPLHLPKVKASISVLVMLI